MHTSCTHSYTSRGYFYWLSCIFKYFSCRCVFVRCLHIFTVSCFLYTSPADVYVAQVFVRSLSICTIPACLYIACAFIRGLYIYTLTTSAFFAWKPFRRNVLSVTHSTHSSWVTALHTKYLLSILSLSGSFIQCIQKGKLLILNALRFVYSDIIWWIP